MFISDHAVQRYKERTSCSGKISNDQVRQFLEYAVKRCNQLLSRLKKKEGLYRWHYYVPARSETGEEIYICVSEDKEVVKSVITAKMFKNLKGRL
jgi:hypothetical protein